MKKKSGVLLHISSLPSDYGIGTFGYEARKFIDFLKKSGQSYWQILPLGPTSFGDSPYSSFSAFAGNPYFIDFDLLKDDGLLFKDEYCRTKWDFKNNRVNYSNLYKKRINILKLAFSRFKYSKDYYTFLNNNNNWIYDYSLFMALKYEFGGKDWLSWPNEYRLKDKKSINNYKRSNYRKIQFWHFVQYEFFKQWNDLKKYANKNGIKIFGDCPIYVSLDSADVWANKSLFQLKTNGYPKYVAGVAPDYFSRDGQLWGNPLYDWDVMKKHKYKWWIDRLKHYETIYDVVRIDHFIGFESYYAIKANSKNAKNGKTIKGPGYDLIKMINSRIKKLKIVAEDLGIVTDDVRLLLKKSKYPGMRVMRFGYNGDTENDNLVKNFPFNSVGYLTSHDTDTCKEWISSCSKKEKDIIAKSTKGFNVNNCNWSLIAELQSSKSYLTIIQAQDILGLGKGNRMNKPGTNKNNWQWRLTKCSFNSRISNKLYEITKKNGRI